MKPLIHVEGNVIEFLECRNSKPIFEFNKVVKESLVTDNNRFDLVFRSPHPTLFPNFCVPLSGLIQYYTKLGVQIRFVQRINAVDSLGIEKPFSISTTTNSQKILNRVFTFIDSAEVNYFIESLSKELLQHTTLETGLIQSIEFSLGEVMDNALRHSGQKIAFIMVQYMPQTKRIAVCIFDYGVGPLETLKKFNPAPTNTTEAIILALQKGASTDLNDNMGFGLWGFSQLVWNNQGSLNLSSDSVNINFKSASSYVTFTCDLELASNRHCFLIDFQLDTRNPIDYVKVIGSSRPVLFTEELETPFGDIVYKLTERLNGTHTREEGRRALNEIYNLISIEKRKVYVDFTDVRTISSGFADEITNKLQDKLGFVNYNHLIQLTKVAPEVSALLERAIQNRKGNS